MTDEVKMPTNTEQRLTVEETAALTVYLLQNIEQHPKNRPSAIC